MSIPASRAVMAIINCTPDSFYTGEGTLPTHEALVHAMRMAVSDGAEVLDIGGYSSRPGATEVSLDEEWRRVERALQAAREVCAGVEKAPLLSVDTFRSEVARRAIEGYGVGMINDISGGLLDEAMYATVAAAEVDYVAMHMRGVPQTMQQLTDYDDVVGEVVAWFEERIGVMLQAGIAPHRILLDPGFGFAKTTEQNYALVAGLERLAALGYPLLVGVSRKSMIREAVGAASAAVLPATTALHWELLHRGARILRVHDVCEARQVIDLYNYYEKTISRL